MADQLITGTTLIEDKRAERGNVWSCLGTAFRSTTPDVTDHSYDSTGTLTNNEAGDTPFQAAVIGIPNGSKITSVVVYGDDATDSYWLQRILLTDGATSDVLATANINTTDITLSNEVVEQNSYAYLLGTDGLSAGKKIFGARIIYE